MNFSKEKNLPFLRSAAQALHEENVRLRAEAAAALAAKTELEARLLELSDLNARQADLNARQQENLVRQKEDLIRQQEDLTRVRSFVKKYGVEYTYVIAGAPVDMWEKVPQAVNLNSWPTTFFVGRDGRVKSVHAGFAAPASGEFYSQLKDEFTGTIERLLAEGNPKLNALNQSPADAARR